MDIWIEELDISPPSRAYYLLHMVMPPMSVIWSFRHPRAAKRSRFEYTQRCMLIASLLCILFAFEYPATRTLVEACVSSTRCGMTLYKPAAAPFRAPNNLPG